MLSAALTALSSSTTLAVTGTVAGTAFEDYNANGVMDLGSNNPSSASATDVGVRGAVVTITDSTGAVVATATTDAAGTFTAAVTAATNDVRVVFDPPTGYVPGPHGPDSGSTVQFVDITGGAAGTVSVGFVRQGNYSPAAPDLLNALQVAAVSVTTGSVAFTPPDLPTLVSSAYADRGFTTPTTEATADQTGAIWGVAQYDGSYAFTAAFFRRHARTGPGGLSAIYLTDLSQAPNAVEWVSVPNAGVNPRSNESSMTPDDWFHDVAAFPEVGKIGLGGLAMAPDRTSLYVVNLNSRSLWQVPFTVGITGMPVAGTPVELALPLSLPGAATSCPSLVRPFGVATQNSAVWVTLTCTGPAASDLRGYIYRYDHATGTFDGAPAFETLLSGYARGNTFTTPAAWNAWEDVTWPGAPLSPTSLFGRASRPQPLLSDVAFDSNGDMTIGIKDRFGDQGGSQAGDLSASAVRYDAFPGGEILRACRNVADTEWVLESNAVCGGRTGAMPNNNEGPVNSAGVGGEFYNDDWPVCCHDQVSLGALLQLPGYGQIINTTFDPGPTNASVRTEGYRFFSNVNGAIDDFHRLRGDANTAPGGGFGKSGGLGDIAALVGAAPIEIGNRVWRDTDGDGIQDAGEPPLAGVTVSLYDDDGVTRLASAITDAEGTYYFGSGAGTNAGNAIFGLATLRSGDDYVVRLDNPTDYTSGGPIAPLGLTTTAAGPDRAVDSDGTLVSGFAQADVTAGGDGVSDHTIDFGFVEPGSLGDFVWEDQDGNGVQGPGEPGIPGVTVHLFQGATEVATAITDGNGRYLFTSLQPGSYSLVFETPPQFSPTTQDAGSDDAVDSDASPTTGATVTIILGPGDVDLTWDAGFVRGPSPTQPPKKTTTTTEEPPPPGTRERPPPVKFPLSQTGTDIEGTVRLAGWLVALGTILLLTSRSGTTRRRMRRQAFDNWLGRAEINDVVSFIDRL